MTEVASREAAAGLQHGTARRRCPDRRRTGPVPRARASVVVVACLLALVLHVHAFFYSAVRRPLPLPPPAAASSRGGSQRWRWTRLWPRVGRRAWRRLSSSSSGQQQQQQQQQQGEERGDDHRRETALPPPVQVEVVEVIEHAPSLRPASQPQQQWLEVELDVGQGGSSSRRPLGAAQRQAVVVEEAPPLLNSLISAGLSSMDFSVGASTISSPKHQPQHALGPPNRQQQQEDEEPPALPPVLASDDGAKPGWGSRVVGWFLFKVMGHVDWFAWGEKMLSRLATKLSREVLFAVMAIFGRELFMREVRVQIESLPPPVQDKASRLMNQTMENLQDKLGFVLATGVTWDTVLRLVQAELKALSKEGIDPLTESVARELLFFAARKVFPDLPLDEWKGNVETISDRTRKALLEYQIKMDVLLNPDGTPLSSATNPASSSPLLSPSPYNATTLADAIQRWLRPDDPPTKLATLGRRLEKLTTRTLEEIMLEVEGEIRYVATGGKAEVAARHIAKTLKDYASEYGDVMREVWGGKAGSSSSSSKASNATAAVSSSSPPIPGSSPSPHEVSSSAAASAADEDPARPAQQQLDKEAELAATYAAAAKRGAWRRRMGRGGGRRGGSTSGGREEEEEEEEEGGLDEEDGW